MFIPSKMIKEAAKAKWWFIKSLIPSVFFVLNTSCANAQGVMAILKCHKVNDSTIVAHMKIKNTVGQKAYLYERIDSTNFSIYSYTLDKFLVLKTDSIKKRWSNLPGSNQIYFDYFAHINTKSTEFQLFENLDSFIVIGIARSKVKKIHGVIQLDLAVSLEYYHSIGGAYQDSIFICVSTVHNKNIKNIKEIKPLRINPKQNQWMNDAFYFSPSVSTQGIEDSLSFSMCNPVGSYYKTIHDSIFRQIPFRPRVWVKGYGPNHPHDIYCLPAGNCGNKSTASYPPIGFNHNKKTGDITFLINYAKRSGYSGGYPALVSRSVILTEELKHYVLNSKGKYVKAFTSVLGNYFLAPTYGPLHKKDTYHDRASRLVYESDVLYVCAEDTLVHILKSTAAQDKAKKLVLNNYYEWDTAIVGASFKTLNPLNKSKKAEFKWVPNTHQISKQPHRFSVFLGTLAKDSKGKYYTSHTNSHTFLIYVVEKQKSKLVIDSLQCGKIYVHAEDTLEIPGLWTYQWNLLNSNDSAVATFYGKQAIITAPVAGDFTLEMVAIPEQGTCPIVRKKQVNIPDFLQSNYILPTNLCAQDSFKTLWIASKMDRLTSIIWQSNSKTQKSLIFNGLAGADSLLTIEIIDTLGCQINDTFNIKAHPIPLLELGEDSLLCKGDSVNFNLLTAYKNMLWNGTETTIDYTAKSPSTTYLQVWDSNGCSQTDSVKLFALETPKTEIIVPKTICEKDSISILFGNTDKQKWTKWNFHNQTYNQNPIKAKIGLPDSITAFFQYDTAHLSCPFEITKNLEVHPLPKFSILAPDTLCASTLPIGFKTTSLHPLTWANDSVFYPNYAYQKGTLFYPNFKQIAKATDKKGCTYTDTATITIEIPDTLIISKLPSKICPRIARIEWQTSSISGQNIIWKTNGGGTVSGNPKTTYSPNGQEENLDSLHFTAALQSSKYCKAYKGEFGIEIGEKADATFATPKKIECVEYSLKTGAINPMDAYKWNLNNTEISSQQQMDSLLKIGNYRIELAVEKGYCKDTFTYQFAVIDTPKVEILCSPKELFLASPIAKLSTNLEGNYSYNWTVSNGQNSTQKAWEVHFAQQGDYLINVLVTSANNCQGRASKILKVWEKEVVYMPTAFTPNSDGHNDYFKPVSIGYTRWTFTVYNIWGELMYFEKEIGTGWDGMANGKPAPKGNYIYVLKLFRYDGEVVDTSGKFVLVR